MFSKTVHFLLGKMLATQFSRASKLCKQKENSAETYPCPLIHRLEGKGDSSITISFEQQLHKTLSSAWFHNNLILLQKLVIGICYFRRGDEGTSNE